MGRDRFAEAGRGMRLAGVTDSDTTAVGCGRTRGTSQASVRCTPFRSCTTLEHQVRHHRNRGYFDAVTAVPTESGKRPFTSVAIPDVSTSNSLETSPPTAR
jgi:hypothetical protein